MSKILKRTVFIQAVVYGSEEPEISLNPVEMESNTFGTYVTLGELVVEFEDPCYSREQFEKDKKTQLEKLKESIMLNAKKQCEALG